MKKINLFTIALAACALSMASCSQDEVIEEETEPESQVLSTEGVYLPLNLKMATSATTRADETVNYDGGIEEEYKIHSAKLLIFEGDKDGDRNYSTYVSDYELPTSELNTTLSNNLSNGGSSVVYLKGLKPKTGKSYYALVLVNKIDEITLPSKGETFAEWDQTTIQAVNSSQEDQLYDSKATGECSNFLMTNALRALDTENGGLDPQSLVDVTKNIQEKRDLAYSSEAATVYVERASAKFSFTESSATGKQYWTSGGTFSNGSYDGCTLKFVGWYVDNVDVQTYPVHTLGFKANGDSPAWGIDAFEYTVDELTYDADAVYDQLLNQKKSVFVGSADNRIYWSFTPRSKGHTVSGVYENTYRTEYKSGKSQFNTYVYKSDGTTPFNSNNQLTDAKGNAISESTSAITTPYCYIPENCQLFPYMTKGTNTRVIFKARFKPEGFDWGEDVFMIGTKPQHADAVMKIIREALHDQSVEMDDFDLEELYKEGEFSANVLLAGSNYGDDELEAINSQLGLNTTTNKLSYYEKGVCYYVAYARHISDNNANWTSGAYTIEHLGRYGVVRNNWYDFQISDVEKPGKPYVPELPNKPGDDPQTDDEAYYLNVKVTLLNWIKHSSSVSDLE